MKVTSRTVKVILREAFKALKRPYLVKLPSSRAVNLWANVKIA